jgi:hypothetical protein
VLYNFSIPDAVYSDMDGFGHFTKPLFSLIAYWGFLRPAAHCRASALPARQLFCRA